MLKWFILGFFGVAALGTIFVQAGKGGGQSGGAQTAQILDSAGGALGSLASSLETGNKG